MTGVKCFMIEKTEKKEVEQCEGGGTITRPLYRLPDGREVTFTDIPIGAMFHGDAGLTVVIPTRAGWNGESDVAFGDKTFFHKSTKEDGTQDGWQWTGEPPNITISPSIFCNSPHGWHGFVRNGEVINA